MRRRQFLTTILAAPAVITTPGLLMPVRGWVDDPKTFQISVYGKNFVLEQVHRFPAGITEDCAWQSVVTHWGKAYICELV